MKHLLLRYLLCSAAIKGIPVTTLLAQPGSIDPTFNVADIGFGNGDGPDQEVWAVARQADGKLLYSGFFTMYNGHPSNHIVRVFPNGEWDPSFNIGTGASAPVFAILIEPDGKILLGGEQESFNGESTSSLLRLNNDGSIDATFAPPPLAGSIQTLALQPDGRLIAGGIYPGVDGEGYGWIARFEEDGDLDPSFIATIESSNSSVASLAISSDGKVYVGGQFNNVNGAQHTNLVRLNSDGSTDLSFDPGTGTDARVRSLLLQPDGRVLVGGDFTTVNGTAQHGLARLLVDGSVDSTFDTGTGFDNTSGPTNQHAVRSLAFLNDARIVVMGDFNFVDGSENRGLVQLNADGSVDAGFDVGAGFQADGTPYMNALLVLPDERLIVAGMFRSYQNVGVDNVARLGTDASLDNTYNTGSGANRAVTAIARQTDGKLIVVGDFTRINGEGRNHIARLHADGTLDEDFDAGAGFTVYLLEDRTSIAIQGDGKVIVSGAFTEFNGTPIDGVVRLNSNGSFDPTFTGAIGGGPLQVQPDGKIIVGGQRLNEDGSLDDTFNSSITSDVLANVLQPDGKIILAGRSDQGNVIFTRLNADGSNDASFNTGAGFSPGWLNALALQPDGDVVVGGRFTSYQGVARNNIVRVNTDGSIDTSFDPGAGIEMVSDPEVLALALQPSGHLVIGGHFTSYNGVARAHIVRADANGMLDTTFDPGSGFDDYYVAFVQALLLQPDGNVVVGGTFTSFNGIGRNRIARLLGGCVAGLTCDDGSANTENDVTDANCVCQGTPIVPCAQNPMQIEFQGDGTSTIQWTVHDGTTDAVVLSDGGVLDAGSPTVFDLCLFDGCYRLVVTDDAGDGITGGGYILRTANGKRIIDDRNNFNSGYTSAISSNGGFCLPLGTVQPIFSSCDKLDWVANKFLVCQADPDVSAEFGVTNANSGYEYWFFDPNGTYSFRRFRSHSTSDGYGTGATRACHFKLNKWINTTLTPHLPEGVLLNVRVRGRVAGADQEFGPACQFKMDAALAACPRVKLQDNPANTSDFSCGVTRSFGGPSRPANRLYANPPQPIPLVPSNQVRYQFRFRNEERCIVRPPQTSARMVLSWTTGDLLVCDETYDVDVRVSLDGGATWCTGSPTTDVASNCAEIEPWGPLCSVTINPCAQGVQSGGGDLAITGELTIHPNPNNGQQLFLSLRDVATGVTTVTVDVYDMAGKRVNARTIVVQDGYLSTVLELNGELGVGIYLVRVGVGNEVYTERMVVQP